MYRAVPMSYAQQQTGPRLVAVPHTDAWRVWLAGPLTALVVFVHEAIFRIATIEQFAVDGQVAFRLAICGACGMFGLAHLSRLAPYLMTFPGVLSWLLCGWAAVTIPEALQASYSATSVVALICVTLFAPAALHELGGRRLVQILLWTLAVYLVASWAAHFIWPELTVDETDDVSRVLGTRRMGGLHSYNGLGRQAALALALSLLAGVTGGAGWWTLAPLMVFALATLVATESRTAMLAAAAAAGVVAAETLPARLNWRFAGAGVFLLCGAGFLLLNGPRGVDLDEALASMSRSGDSEEMYHLTGRVELWEDVVALIQKAPIVGYGWGGARFLLVDGAFSTHHAHNLLLNAALCAGIFGAAIVAAMLIWQLLAMFYRPKLFPDVLLALVLVGGVADNVMFNPIPDSHTLLWTMALYWRAMDASLSASPQLAWRWA